MWELYFLFALTTGIFALIDIFIPVLVEAKKQGANNVLVKNPGTSCLVYLITGTLIAPFLIAPLLVPSMNARFKSAMLKNALED